MISYAVALSAIAVTNAQDLFEIVAAPAANLRISEIMLSQYSDFGDAQDEIISVQIIRGYTTSGAGGAAVTPRPLNRYLPAAQFSAARNNTTLAQDGTSHLLMADGFNVRAGWYWKAPTIGSGRFKAQTPAAPHSGAAMNMPNQIIFGPSERGVIRITAPNDSLTMNATLIVDEFRG